LTRALYPTVLLAAFGAAAGAPVVLYEPNVPPYREAADAAHGSLSGSLELDLSDPAAEARLADAPVIVAVGKKAMSFAQARAPKTPLVFCMVLGVTRAALTPYVTGLPMEPDPATTLASIVKLRPGTSRIGLVYNPAFSELFADEAQKGAAAAGLKLVTKTVSGAAEARDAVRELAGSVDVLWLPPDAHLFGKEVFLALLSFSAERNLPLISFLDTCTQAGALASVSADYTDIGARAGRLASDIAQRPADKRIPVPGLAFSPGRLTINLKTAEALGVKVPAAAVAAAKQTY
jgi:putative ABC transport system substrate-binding protein